MSVFVIPYELWHTQIVNSTVTQSVLFFTYTFFMPSALFLKYKNAPPPSANFKSPTKNCVTQSVRIFLYKKHDANCLDFLKYLDFFT